MIIGVEKVASLFFFFTTSLGRNESSSGNDSFRGTGLVGGGRESCRKNKRSEKDRKDWHLELN